MKTLDLQRVSVRFGKVEALRDVTLEVKAGETMILVGPNGAGKSTLVKVILGLVRPAAGVLVVDGKRRRVDNAFKCHLGYLPEAVAFADASPLEDVGDLALHLYANTVPVPEISLTGGAS